MEPAFDVEEVFYGRVLRTDSGDTLVSPLTTVHVDPETGVADPASLEPLATSVDVDEWIPFDLGPRFVPPTVPRDAGFVVRFRKPLDPASIVADRFDAKGKRTRPGSIQLADRHGQFYRTILRVIGERDVLVALDEPAPVLPRSPLGFGPGGTPAKDPEGHVRLLVPSGGPHVPRTPEGETLVPRADGLGEEATGIGCNPGNERLDFIHDAQLLPVTPSYAGFLPDDHAPRIVRVHAFEATLNPAGGDRVGKRFLEDADASFDVLANGGLGEWAQHFLIVRPDAANEERVLVQLHDATRLELEDPIAELPESGDRYRLERLEYFEPNPAHPLDPDVFDPDNPENDNNIDLANFLQVREIDARGEPFGPLLDPTLPLPAFSEIGLRFDTPMSVSSLNPWESVRVALNPDPGPDAELMTRIVHDERRERFWIQPVRDDSETGESVTVGWGPGVRKLQLLVRSLPGDDFLLNQLGRSRWQDLLDRGARTVRSSAGVRLAVPTHDFDAGEPFTLYRHLFTADEAISSQSEPPESLDWRVLVHRFQGQPVAANDPDTDAVGWRFHDHEGVYHPLPDGFDRTRDLLTGQPLSFLTKVHDDFVPPPDSPLTPQTSGVSTPLLHDVRPTDGAAPWSFQGARFQHLYRDVDASPSLDLAGTLLDLYRVSFAPIGGNVTADTYQNVSLHAAHSHLRPITAQDGVNLHEPGYGLSEAFDQSTFEKIWLEGEQNLCPGSLPVEGPNYLPNSRVTCVAVGTTWKLSQSQLFTPPGTEHPYHAWPEFTQPFQYNNGDRPAFRETERQDFNAAAGEEVWLEKREDTPLYDNRGGDSLLLEYRLRPQVNAISGRNGFTFALGALVAPLPNYRVFSRGTSANPLFPDRIDDDPRARCAVVSAGGSGLPGDNARYFATFDYAKTTSKLTSPFIRTENTQVPSFETALLWPPLDDAPTGASLSLLYQGADSAAGDAATATGEHPSIGDGHPFLRVVIEFVGSRDPGLTPVLDTVAIPYLR